MAENIVYAQWDGRAWRLPDTERTRRWYCNRCGACWDGDDAKCPGCWTDPNAFATHELERKEAPRG